MSIIPVPFFLTKGVGVQQRNMRAYENALRHPGIQNCHLINVSSVIAPGCRRMTVEEGTKQIPLRQIRFAVLTQLQTNVPAH